MKFAVKVFASIAAVVVCSPLWAATYTFEAITDFTNIDAGEVPYYRHNGVNALAINAAIENFRDRFARATLEFEQDTGRYDVTITSLGETDGDGEFRFLVNGEVVGSSVNAPADTDYGEQLHIFENISIPQGALIGVESIAVSNGKIPEGDAYAYARGRWTKLTISDAEEVIAVPDPVVNVDLGLELSTDNGTTTAGEEISVGIRVENFSEDTATNPVVTVTFSEGIGNLASDTCVESDSHSMTCALVELGGNEENSFTITATALTFGDAEITAVVSSDQTDPESDNNSDNAAIEIQSAELPIVETPEVAIPEVTIPADDTVDLELSLSANKERVEVGDTVDYTVTVTNAHKSNTATSPAADIVLPASLQFVASSTCTANELSIICAIQELPPGVSAEATFTATAVSVNSNSAILATASSSQTDSVIANNETQIITDVSPITVQNVVTPPDQQAGNNSTSANTSTTDNTGAGDNSAVTDTTSITSTRNTKSGGGVLQLPAGLYLLAAFVLYSRRRSSLSTTL